MQIIAVLAALALYSVCATARRQWYYTGKLHNTEVQNAHYEGGLSTLWPLPAGGDTFDAAGDPPKEMDPDPLSLMYGGVLSNFSHYNGTAEDHYGVYVKALLGSEGQFTVRGVWTLDLYTSRNYADQLLIEIGLYDHDQRKYIERANMTGSIGHTAVISVDEILNMGASAVCRAHVVVMSVDPKKNISPLQHIWRDSTSLSGDCGDASMALVSSLNGTYEGTSNSEQVSRGSEGAMESAEDSYVPVENVAVMTYNIWHTNPAAWLYSSPSIRWDRYWKRIRLFVNTILNDDPDVILLQEVRFDARFSGSQLKGYLESPDSGLDVYEKRCVVSGSQIEQVRCMLELMSARRRAEERSAPAREISGDRCVVSTDGSMVCEDDSSMVLPPVESLKVGNTYQFAFQPAMSMVNSEYPWLRGEEEGVAVIVKSQCATAARAQRISHVDTMLLPRTLNDPSDDHQRVLIHVEIELTPRSGEALSLLYDVYTSHLSLSESARSRSYDLIRKHMNTGRGSIQFFGGDLNAEPGEAGILALLDASSWFGEPPLIDLWSNHTGGDSGDMSSGYTFPTCKPVKRIDYLFFRRRNTKISVKVLTSDVRIVGRDASTDTAHLVGSRPDMGMMDMDSPLWASDHMALVANISITW